MANGNRIEAEGIAYSYGDRLAVDHISFRTSPWMSCCGAGVKR